MSNFNAADPRQARRSNAVAKASHHRDNEDLRYVLRDERGRRTLYGIMLNCGLFADIAVGKPDTYVRIGERKVALEIKRRIDRLDPGAWLKMAAEYESTAHIDVLEAQMPRGDDDGDY